MEGQVRAVLWKHLASREALQDPSGGDPTAFLPATGFDDALRAHAARNGAESVRESARDYVRLWSRTFPVLVRHLRGRPERSLSLFCSEVYPYLRGHALAGRIESLTKGRARLVLESDIDETYICGLLEGFVGLTGAEANARPLGAGRFEVRFHIHPADRFGRAVNVASRMRIPLLATAVAGAAIGAAMAPAALPLPVVLVIIGTLAAQFAANGLHDSRNKGPASPLAVPDPAVTSARVRMVTGYAIAGTVAAVFIVAGRLGVIGLALAGALLSLLYPIVRDQGLGPVVAGAIHGPLIVLGSLYAVSGGLPSAGPAILGSLGAGALVAALLFVDDLADRPLDEAGGRRTMAVRLPRRIHVLGFAGLVATGVLGFAAAAWVESQAIAAAVAAVAGAIGGSWLVIRVARGREDPLALAPARLGTFALHITLASILLLSLVIL